MFKILREEEEKGEEEEGGGEIRILPLTLICHNNFNVECCSIFKGIQLVHETLFFLKS